MADNDHTHDNEPDAMQTRVKALESLLVEKGYVEAKALDEIIETYETKIGPRNGAKVVARAWCEPEFFESLINDGTKAVHSMGFTSRQGEHIIAVANEDNVHHLVVCTLCSCYPWSVLGLPPVWYKSPAYRAKAVANPRGTLKDFGVEVGENTQIYVHDSTAETRYLVVPQRPKNTEGWSQEELEKLVTRNSMIGTGHALDVQEGERNE